MFPRICPNPVLETKQDALLAEEQESRHRSLQVYQKAVSHTKHIHSSLLFTTELGRLILKSICRMVSSVQPNTYNTSWLDLAAKLGFNDAQIKCVPNLQGQVLDPTQQIITFFAASRRGLVGDLLQALLDLEFVAAVEEAHHYIDDFVADVECKKSDGSTILISSEGQNVLVAANFNPYVPIIFDSLPSNTNLVQKDYVSVKEETLLLSPTQPCMKKQYCKIVLLSFALDGLDVARKMAHTLRAKKNNRGFPIGVVILSENEEQVISNPGKVLISVLSQVNFVIPVLTEGYFNALLKPDSQAPLLDERYIQYIHDAMLSKFIHSQCINFHVRPLIPKPEVNNICRKNLFAINTMFKPFRTDDEMEYLALSILKSRKDSTYT